MATRPQSQPTTGVLKLPESLTLKDLITVVSVAVSLTVGWGVFSTRIAVLEREVVSQREAEVSRVSATDKIQQQVRRLESHQQDDELILDQVFSLLRKSPPTRRADR